MSSRAARDDGGVNSSARRVEEVVEHHFPARRVEHGVRKLETVSWIARFPCRPGVDDERPAYALAKSGLTALTRHVASRWGKQRIRANAVAPGLILTPAVRAGSMADHAIARVPHTRLGEPADIAAAVAFLLSDDAEWINGQVLSVDGGATMRA